MTRKQLGNTIRNKATNQTRLEAKNAEIPNPELNTKQHKRKQRNSEENRRKRN